MKIKLLIISIIVIVFIVAVILLIIPNNKKDFSPINPPENPDDPTINPSDDPTINPPENPPENPVVPNDQVNFPKYEFNINLDYFGDYFTNFPLKNRTYYMLLDTGSSPVVINYDQFVDYKLKPVDYPKDKIVYLGIEAIPQGWYEEEFKNRKFPVAAVKSNGVFPNILGLAEYFNPPPYSVQYENFTNWNYFDNYTFDFINRKFIINDDDSSYDYVFERDLEFVKKFKTTFFAINLFLKGKKVPVIIDTGLSFGIFHLLSTGPEPAKLTDENGNNIFVIEPNDQIELPKDTWDPKWAETPFIIISNKSLLSSGMNYGLKILLNKTIIKLKKIPFSKTTTLQLTEIKNINEQKQLDLNWLKSRYS